MSPPYFKHYFWYSYCAVWSYFTYCASCVSFERLPYWTPHPHPLPLKYLGSCKYLVFRVKLCIIQFNFSQTLSHQWRHVCAFLSCMCQSMWVSFGVLPPARCHSNHTHNLSLVLLPTRPLWVFFRLSAPFIKEDGKNMFAFSSMQTNRSCCHQV